MYGAYLPDVKMTAARAARLSSDPRIIKLTCMVDKSESPSRVVRAPTLENSLPNRLNPSSDAAATITAPADVDNVGSQGG